MSELKKQLIEVKVPAKVMLSGEYAVMSGHSSLSLALNKYVRVNLSKSSKEFSEVHSSLWKKPILFKNIKECDLLSEPLLHSISNAVEKASLEPFHFSIENDFCVSSGFGSSSALRLAVHTAFHLFSQKNSLPKWELAKKAYDEQHAYQSRGSGYDLVTQTLGGLVQYKIDETSWPHSPKKLFFDKRLLKRYLHIFVGGKGASTKAIMPKTHNWLKSHPGMKEFFHLSDDLTKTMLSFFQLGEKKESLISLVALHRKFMSESSFHPHDLEKALQKLSGCDKKWSFKTTGSGGEDALLFFGDELEIEEAKKLLEEKGWKKEKWDPDETGVSYAFASKE